MLSLLQRKHNLKIYEIPFTNNLDYINVKSWCHKNFGPRGTTWDCDGYTYIFEYVGQFCFLNDKDLVAFKLAWC